jgi:hypothetical protein
MVSTKNPLPHCLEKYSKADNLCDILFVTSHTHTLRHSQTLFKEHVANVDVGLLLLMDEHMLEA